MFDLERSSMRRQRGVGVGTAAELLVASIGRELGYLVCSRRHEGGAGDQLWLPPWTDPTPLVPEVPLLIEVKATAKPWDKFRTLDRSDLLSTAAVYGCEAMLAWKPPGLP